MDRKLTTTFGDPMDDSQNTRSVALVTAAVTYDIGKYKKAKQAESANLYQLKTFQSRVEGGRS
jgi:hypothetical protein